MHQEQEGTQSRVVALWNREHFYITWHGGWSCMFDWWWEGWPRLPAHCTQKIGNLFPGSNNLECSYCTIRKPKRSFTIATEWKNMLSSVRDSFNRKKRKDQEHITQVYWDQERTRTMDIHVSSSMPPMLYTTCKNLGQWNKRILLMFI